MKSYSDRLQGQSTSTGLNDRSNWPASMKSDSLNLLLQVKDNTRLSDRYLKKAIVTGHSKGCSVKSDIYHTDRI